MCDCWGGEGVGWRGGVVGGGGGGGEGGVYKRVRHQCVGVV